MILIREKGKDAKVPPINCYPRLLVGRIEDLVSSRVGLEVLDGLDLDLVLLPGSVTKDLILMRNRIPF